MSARLISLAARYGTPLFAYDLAAVRARMARARAAFGPRIELFYAVKANPALVPWIAPIADGMDVASRGELSRARACVPDARITFAGPGKTDRDLAAAEGAIVVAESIAEISRIRPGQMAMLRLNPEVAIRAFAVSTAGGPSPFGIDPESLEDAVRAARHLDLAGLHVHAGSQCASARAYMEHAAQVLDLAARMIALGAPPRRICLGGGLASGDPGIDVESLGAALDRALEKWSARTGVTRPIVSLELGRWLVADAGTYVAQVVSTKRSRGTDFAILDGGMHHLIAATGLLGNPPLAASCLTKSSGGPLQPVTLVGPLCTPLDTLARGAMLPAPSPGDLIAFAGAGAYGATLSPGSFLGHDRAVELVDDDGHVSVL